jgi:arsenate reductase
MERLISLPFINLLRRPAALFALIVVVAAFIATSSGPQAGERANVDASTVVFVCAHGAVKSTVAAAHFNRIARERGLAFVAVSRGIDLYSEIPATIRTGLAADGLTPNDDTPRDLRADEASAAARVIAFDPVPTELGGTATVTYWPDMPAVTKDYGVGREAIVRRIEQMVNDLAAR